MIRRLNPVLSKTTLLAVCLLVSFSLAHAAPAEGDDAKPACDAHFDSQNNKVVVVVLDLSKVSHALVAKNAKVNVGFLDGPGGKTIHTETFQFTDGDQSLVGGHKYFRRFEYDLKNPAGGALTVKALGAEAVLVPDVGAIQPTKEK